MKKELGAKNLLYPLPTTLVGTLVDGKPNFIAIAHVGILDPGSVSLGMNKVHYTNAGIKENESFSINIPSVDMVKVTDYCGLVSGKKVDKSHLFDVFYGRLRTAPMIDECPVTMECRLLDIYDFPKHDIFIGEIVASYANENILTDGLVDWGKVRPILFSMVTKSYWQIGNKFAQAWSIGKDLKK